VKGHVRRRGDAWRIFYDLGPDPLTGRRRLRSATVHGSRDEAERRLQIILGKVAEDAMPDPQKTTVSQFAGRWLSLVEASLRPSTVDGYRQKLDLACKTIGSRELRSLTGDGLTDLYRRIPRSAQTVMHVHRVLHRMLSDAVRWGLLARNPADSALPPRVPKPELDTWSVAEVTRFLEQTGGDRLAGLWRLACTTGMRRGELCGLRWPAVDLARGLLTVVESRVMVNGRPQVGQPKTRAGRRRVALDPQTVRILEDHRAGQEAERAWLGAGYQSGGWVFCWEDGHPYSPDWVSRRFVNLTDRTGLRRIRFHDLRHTYATLALEAGVAPKVVSDRLGHAGIRITLDTYTHHSDNLDRQAARQVAALVDG